MSKLDANVGVKLSIRAFMCAADQFANDNNLTKKYWSREDTHILQSLVNRITQSFYPQPDCPSWEEITRERDGNMRLEDIFQP